MCFLIAVLYFHINKCFSSVYMIIMYPPTVKRHFKFNLLCCVPVDPVLVPFIYGA